MGHDLGRKSRVHPKYKTKYRVHYHSERNHQGLDNQLIEKSRDELRANDAIERRERLGGVLKYYYRRAA